MHINFVLWLIQVFREPLLSGFFVLNFITLKLKKFVGKRLALSNGCSKRQKCYLSILKCHLNFEF